MCTFTPLPSTFFLAFLLIILRINHCLYLSVYIENFEQKRVQVFGTLKEKCVDAYFLMFVEKIAENSGEMRRR